MTSQPQKSVLALAALVLLLVMFSAYFTDRDGGSFGGDFDELVLQNPAYMLARFGHLTFFNSPVVSHPPIHVGEIGLLMRLGFSIYYAEATPTVLLFLLAIAAIVRSVFPTPVKLGLLFSIGFLASTGETLTLCFGTRPEGEVHAAWILGLVLLESGRLDNWNRTRLFAGAFFLTWASGVHYYAVAAFVGVAVYVVWAVCSLGWRESRGRIAALCAGGCLFGIPYLALFLIPHSQEIRETVMAFQGSGGMALSVSRHLELYRSWTASPDHPAVVRMAMAAGVPLLLFSTAILAAVSSTRGLALAALPLQAFILLFSLHKPPFYLVHECVLFVTALGIGLLVCADRISARLRPLAVGLLVVFLLWGSPTLARAEFSIRPKVHEAIVARAASREILGPHARVAGREAGWYVSGAAHWYDIQQDFSPGSLLYDPRTYLSNLDAVVDFTNDSQGPLTTWYADGLLRLRGFYFGETSDQFRLVYLSVREPPRVVGYALRNGRLSRFQEDAAGDYAVLSTVCAIEQTGWLWPYRKTSSSILRFPSDSPDASRVLVTILAPRSAMAPEGEIGRSCREVSKIQGTLQPADKDGLVAGLQRNDPPIQFARILDEMPGYSGVGLPASAIPPSEAVRVDGILDLPSIVAHPNGRVERTPDPRVTTGRGIGTFSALIPVNHPEAVHGPCWVVLRLRVVSGQIGFAAYDRRKGSILARTARIAGSPAPQTIALEIPNLATATDIVIFNQSALPSGGLVDILDAAVLVKRNAARE